MEEDSDDSYLDEYYYYNDDDDEEEEDCGFWDGVNRSETFSGFRPSFLYSRDYKLHTINYITKEEADKNAKELLEEEKREKEKADKKRLKKKRQKDRKREQRQKEVEKPAGENLAPVDNTGSADSEDIVQDDTGELGNEDDLDLGSCFVRQAQKKMENKPKPERRERGKEVLRESGRDKSQDSAVEKAGPRPEKMAACPPAAPRNGLPADQYKVQESMDLASIGNNLANQGKHIEALHYYTEAIRLNPGEYRFLGNRSYSYERVGRHKEALQDAEKSLELQPLFVKGHFRKGKALKGLKRYPEAIAAFRQVLSCDLNRTEAEQEIADCQRKQQELTVSTSTNLTSFGPRSVRPSVPGLLGQSNNKVFVPRILVYRRSNNAGQVAPRDPPAAKPVSSTLYPVWVGNITGRVTEDALRSQFTVFGAIQSIRILYSRTCAFVNFTSKDSAESAFRALQGLNIEGTTLALQLRNPEHSHLNPGGGGAKKPGK